MWRGSAQVRQLLYVSAVLEPPITVELGAGGITGKARVDAGPARLPMSLHVVVGDTVGDALIAQGLDQPLEQAGSIMSLNSSGEAVLAASSAVNDKFGIACQAADAVHEIDRVIAIGPAEFLVQSRCSTARIIRSVRPACAGHCCGQQDIRARQAEVDRS